MSNLVAIKNGQALTSSIQIAEHFKKQHKNVLQSLENLDCSPEFTRLNFQLSEYKDSTGRSLPMYLMTKDGFSFLVMGFTGKEAAKFKEAFIAAFNELEKALLRQQNDAWKESRLNGKQARKDLTDTIQNFVAYAKAQGSTHAGFYYANITKMTYKCLALLEKGAKVGPSFRDLMDTADITFLSAAEYWAENALQLGMDEGLHYKQIYEHAKNRVELYAHLNLPVMSSKKRRHISA